MNGEMWVYFESSNGDVREIAHIEELETFEAAYFAAVAVIDQFCRERDFKIHYMRVWDSDELFGRLMTKFDVGSHTEFFYADVPGLGNLTI